MLLWYHDPSRSTLPLVFEDFAISQLPALPPGFHASACEGDPWPRAIEAAESGAEPGTVLWNDADARCRAAFVLTPDRMLDGPGIILNLGALALFDAVAVLAPPQTPMHIIVPNGLAVDGGQVATVRTVQAPTPRGGIPDWAVLGMDVAIGANLDDPGEQPDRTSLLEEGFGEVTAAELLLHVSRHLLGWVDAWQHDGDAALAQAVALRSTMRTLAA